MVLGGWAQRSLCAREARKDQAAKSEANSEFRRALASGGPVEASPRWSRILRIAPRSLTKAITFMSPPHFAQRSASSLKTRLNKSAHGIREGCLGGGASGETGACGAAVESAAGITAALHDEFGAKTPWNRTRWTRCGGTSAASLRKKSSGCRSSAVLPSCMGRFIS